MKIDLYSIKDIKSAEYSAPVAAPAHQIGRFCGGLASVVGSDYNLYPSDFEVWKLGTFDTDTADLVSEKSFVSNFCNIREVKAVLSTAAIGGTLDDTQSKDE